MRKTNRRTEERRTEAFETTAIAYLSCHTNLHPPASNASTKSPIHFNCCCLRIFRLPLSPFLPIFGSCVSTRLIPPKGKQSSSSSTFWNASQVCCLRIQWTLVRHKQWEAFYNRIQPCCTYFQLSERFVSAVKLSKGGEKSHQWGKIFFECCKINDLGWQHGRLVPFLFTFFW